MIISAFSDGITAIERGGVHFPIALTRTASGNQFFPSFGLLEVFNRLRIYNYLFHFNFVYKMGCGDSTQKYRINKKIYRNNVRPGERLGAAFAVVSYGVGSFLKHFYG